MDLSRRRMSRGRQASTFSQMRLVDTNELQSRLEERILTWRIRVEDVVHTASSVLAFGRRDEQPVVLKLVNAPGNEWRSGQVVDAFSGCGVVRALEYADGAVLLEQILPGKSLGGESIPDHEATAIIADVIARMSPGPPPTTAVTIESWGQGFERYRARGAEEIPRPLVEAAQRCFKELCASQATPRLLHGDLHHHNVLLDAQRGWLAIDPKGVVGELAYEVGAALRNPYERPDLFTVPALIMRRVDCFASRLRLEGGRILAWAFAQAVLAAIWEWEDDGVLSKGTGWIAFANAVRPMLDGTRWA